MISLFKGHFFSGILHTFSVLEQGTVGLVPDFAGYIQQLIYNLEVSDLRGTVCILLMRFCFVPELKWQALNRPHHSETAIHIISLTSCATHLWHGCNTLHWDHSSWIYKSSQEFRALFNDDRKRHFFMS